MERAASYPRSKTIPFPKYHVHETESELQLRNSQDVAEYRDFLMFDRLMRGVKKSHDRIQQSCNCEKADMELPYHVMARNRQVIESIISTRSCVSEDKYNTGVDPSFVSTIVDQYDKTLPQVKCPIHDDRKDDDWFMEGTQDNLFSGTASTLIDMDYSQPPSSTESIVSDSSVVSEDEEDIFHLEL